MQTKLAQQIAELLTEQRKLLSGKVTDEVSFEYKKREREIRRLFTILEGGNQLPTERRAGK